MKLAEVLERVEAALGTAAAAHGFLPEQPGKVLDGRQFLVWVRNRVWKLDRIEVSHRVKTPRELIVNFEVRLPLEDGRRIPLDGKGLSWLARPGDIGYELPSGTPGPRVVDDLSDHVVRDLDDQVGWFERLYGTPQKCLSRLETQEGRNGCRAGFPPAVEHLKRAAAQSN